MPKRELTTEEKGFHLPYSIRCASCGENAFIVPNYGDPWTFKHDGGRAFIPNTYIADHGEVADFIAGWCRMRHPDVMADICDERERQDDKWGGQNHDPLYWLGIIGEEFGELAKELIEPQADYAAARCEAIHLAACVVAMIESLDRNELSHGTD